MKKVIIIMLVVLIALVGGYYAYLKIQKPRLAIEDVFPEKPVAFIRMHNTYDLFLEMQESSFWKEVGALDVDTLSENRVVTVQQKQIFEFLQTQTGRLSDSQVFKKLFGKEVAIGVYNQNLNIEQLTRIQHSFNPELLEDIFSNLVFATRVGADMQLAEFITTAIGLKSDDMEIERRTYGNTTMMLVFIPKADIRIGFTRLQDLIIAGVGEIPVKTMIDVFNSEKVSLSKDPGFEDMQKLHLKSSDVVASVDLQKIIEKSREQSSVITGSSDATLLSALTRNSKFYDRLEGLDTLNFSVKIDQLTKLKFAMSIDKSKLKRKFTFFDASCVPKENNTLSFVPEGTLLYMINHCLNLSYYWEQIKDEAESLGEGLAAVRNSDVPFSLNSRVREIEENLGFKIEDDLIPAVGNEFGAYLLDLQVSGLFPIPQLVVFLKVGRKDKFDKVMNLLTEKIIFMMQKEQYKETTIHSLSIAFQQQLQPSYCFLDDYLLISANKQMLKNAIDMSDSNEQLLKDTKEFKSLGINPKDPLTGAFFANADQVIKKTKELIEWGNNFQAGNQGAAISGNQKKLGEVSVKVDSLKSEFVEMENRFEFLQEDLEKLTGEGLDATAKENELEELESQLSRIRLEHEEYQEQEQELMETIRALESRMVNQKAQRVMLDEFFYPLLDGLMTIESVGSYSTNDQNIFETHFNINFRK